MSRKKKNVEQNTEENMMAKILPSLLFIGGEKQLHLWERWYKLILSRLGEKADGYTEREIRLMLRIFIFMEIYELRRSPEQILQLIREDFLIGGFFNFKKDDELPSAEKLSSFLASLSETGTAGLILLDYSATSKEIEEDRFDGQQQLFD